MVFTSIRFFVGALYVGVYFTHQGVFPFVSGDRILAARLCAFGARPTACSMSIKATGGYTSRPCLLDSGRHLSGWYDSYFQGG